MSKNTAAPASKTKASGKMTRAEFLVALDEANATLSRQIEEVKQSQVRNQATREKMRASSAEIRKRLLNL